MTATDELRLMLTDMEMKYTDVDEYTTYWDGILDGTKCGIWRAYEYDGLLHIMFSDDGDFVTPQEAITATVGRGTCHDKGNIERFICSECGCRLDLQDDDWEATMWLDEAAMVPNFCPNCGRKVVDE